MQEKLENRFFSPEGFETYTHFQKLFKIVVVKAEKILKNGNQIYSYNRYTTNKKLGIIKIKLNTYVPTKFWMSQASLLGLFFKNVLL